MNAALPRDEGRAQIVGGIGYDNSDSRNQKSVAISFSRRPETGGRNRANARRGTRRALAGARRTAPADQGGVARRVDREEKIL